MLTHNSKLSASSLHSVCPTLMRRFMFSTAATALSDHSSLQSPLQPQPSMHHGSPRPELTSLSGPREDEAPVDRARNFDLFSDKLGECVQVTPLLYCVSTRQSRLCTRIFSRFPDLQGVLVPCSSLLQPLLQGRCIIEYYRNTCRPQPN